MSDDLIKEQTVAFHEVQVQVLLCKSLSGSALVSHWI